MPISNILALDVGEVRVGVALARAEVQIPVVLTTLQRQAEDFWEQLTAMIIEHAAGQLVIGLPRGLDGQETAQTAYVRSFADELASRISLPMVWQDEAVTSVKAEESLKSTNKPYEKADIDALAACFILSDYLDSARITT